MLLEKQPLSMEELESQSAIELPERDTLLVTIVIGRIDVIDDITITVRNVDIAAQICAQLIATGNFTCEPVANQ